MNPFDLILRRGAWRSVPPSTEDWKAGDLAVCVNDRWSKPCSHAPRKEELLRVRAITHGRRALQFVGKPDDESWDARAFRKIRPRHEAADAEFREQLKRAHSKVPA